MLGFYAATPTEKGSLGFIYLMFHKFYLYTEHV